MTDYPSRPVAALFIATDRPDDVHAAASNGLRIGQRIRASLPKSDPDSGAPLPMLECPFSAVVLGYGAPNATIPALQGLVRHAAAHIDLAASVLLVGTEFTVKPGEGGVVAAMLVRRRADYDLAAFRRRWLDGHAPFGLRVPVSGYRQWHAEPATFADLPAGDRFDGAGIVLFDDADRVAAARADPAIARDATRDEMQFIDHARSMLALFRFTD
jgi:hypothetical protein